MRTRLEHLNTMTTRIIPIVPVNGRPTEDKIQVRSISGVFTRWHWAMVWITPLAYDGPVSWSMERCSWSPWWPWPPPF